MQRKKQKNSEGGERYQHCIGIHQGVITCMSPVETFATRIIVSRFTIGKKCAWSLDLLWVKGQIGAMHSWAFDFRSLEVTLILWSALKKGFELNFDPSRKCFYKGHVSELPLDNMGIMGSRCPPPFSLNQCKSWQFVTSLAPVDAADTKSRQIATVPKVHT